MGQGDLLERTWSTLPWKGDYPAGFARQVPNSPLRLCDLLMGNTCLPLAPSSNDSGIPTVQLSD